MLPEARIEHNVAGRLRLRVPAMRGDDEYFQRLRDELSSLAAAGTVSVTPHTGSILLEDTTLRAETLARTARQRRWFILTRRRPGRARRTLLPQALTDMLGGGNTTSSLVAILIALAILQAARGQVMVPALSLLMFAFELLRKEESAALQSQARRSSADRALH